MRVLTLFSCSGDLFALFPLNKICDTFGFPLLIEVEKYGEQTCKMWSVVSSTKHYLFTYTILLISFSEKKFLFISIYV